LKGLAKNHFSNIDKSDTFRHAVGNILTAEARSKTSAGEPRKYRDLLKGRFRLDQVVRIGPRDYSHSISGRGADFTSQTIKAMIEKGKEDAFRLLG